MTAFQRLFLAVPLWDLVPARPLHTAHGSGRKREDRRDHREGAGSDSDTGFLRLAEVLAALRRMGRPVKPVAPGNLHVTLRFLGDTAAERIPEIIQAATEVAAASPAFDWLVTGLGAFPRADRPSVVWAGLTPVAPCEQLASRLADVLELLGFPRELRPFHPHLTLARVTGRPPRELASLLRTHRETGFGRCEVRHVELVRSDRQPDGPHYTTLARCALQPFVSE